MFLVIVNRYFKLPIPFKKKLETNKADTLVKSEVLCTVADPDPGSGAFETPESGSGMNIQDHITESLEQCFGLKILKFFCVDADPGSGSEIFLTLDGIREKFGSRIRNTVVDLDSVLSETLG